MTATENSKCPCRRLALLLLMALAAIALVPLLCSGILTNNFHVVTHGRLYRSAQMHEKAIRARVSAYGIRTIIDLDGDTHEAWHAEEIRTANELGVKHLDIGISSGNLPSPDRMKELLRAFKEGPYPMLIHCWAGSDRTGLASAVYRVVIEHQPFESAVKEQLTWRYGHLAIGKWRAMDDFFDLYRKTGNGKDLETWIKDKEGYPAVYSRLNPAHHP